jgi:hypothetical protein
VYSKAVFAVLQALRGFIYCSAQLLCGYIPNNPETAMAGMPGKRLARMALSKDVQCGMLHPMVTPDA